MGSSIAFFRPRVVSVAYAATVTPNVDVTELYVVGALTNNVTLANPTGSPAHGQKLEVQFTQDGTGGRTLTLGNKFRFPTSSSLSSPISEANFIVASKKSKLLCEYDSAADKWDVVSFLPGY